MERLQCGIQKIWYRQPATLWKEALPLGNGRIGLMVYGGTEREVLDLTEVTNFSGEASEYNNQPGAPEAFKKMRAAYLAGDYKAGIVLGEGVKGIRHNYGTNLPVGHLTLDTDHLPENCRGYVRSLELNTGVARVEYSTGGCRFERTTFVSNPDQVAVMRITCSKPHGLDMLLGLDGGDNPHEVKTDGNEDLLLEGNAYEQLHSDGTTGVTFHARLRVLTVEGQKQYENGKLQVRQANQALLLLAVETDFDNRNTVEGCLNRIEAAAALGYEKLISRHEKDVARLFERVKLELGEDNWRHIPTDLRVEGVRKGEEDPALTALMFQYGRYLLLSSSREDSPLPAHLQGVWNDNVASRIGWTCDMHLDINTQMNYWPAEVTNLSECTEPLFQWIEERLVPSGRRTAHETYGMNGWVAELVSNAWGFTAPYWHVNLSPCPTGGVWIATHLWEHYLFTGDKDFLEAHVYPVLREAVEFFLKYIFEDPETGCLTCGPSISPENMFKVQETSYPASIGCTYEMVMIRELFQEFLEASRTLGESGALVQAQQVKAAVDRLLPFSIGNRGELKEWGHDFPESDPQHRHTSHLLSLFPFAQITPDNTPELAEAASVSLRLRTTPAEGWEDTGWARSMLMLYAARLRKPEEAYAHICSMQQNLTHHNLMVKHPPTRGAGSFADVYELDGNTGLTACIAEMLLQSHQGEIHLLPALPSAWRNGRVYGLCARGGFTVDMEWREGILTCVQIHSRYAKCCHIRYNGKRICLEAQAGSKWEMNGRLEIQASRA